MFYNFDNIVNGLQLPIKSLKLLDYFGHFRVSWKLLGDSNNF